MLLVVLGLTAFLIFFKLFREFGKTREIIINMNDADKEKLKNFIENIVSQQPQSATAPSDPERISAVDPDEALLQSKFPDFSKTSFLIKADERFDSIFNGFANSHHYLLKSMLTESLYESFAEQIARRESRNLRQELLIKHKSTTMDKILVLAEKAEVFITFSVSQMSAIINSDGVSYDNPKRLYRDVIHRWVFERSFDKDSWLLARVSQGQSL